MGDNVKGKVLIVEDEESLLQAYERTLAKNGYDTKTSNSAELAKEILKEFKADLILLDVILPKTSGFEFMEYLKSSKNTAGIFIVLISSKVISAENKSLGLESGADGYLVKPVSNRELVAWTDAFMRHKIILDKLAYSNKNLEELVRERTAELEEKIEELEHFNELFVGREFRIKELKEKIRKLEDIVKGIDK